MVSFGDLWAQGPLGKGLAQESGADWLHFDVMDGRFVPNISMGMPILRSLKRVATIPIDVHLMIVEPERYVQAFADAGAASISAPRRPKRDIWFLNMNLPDSTNVCCLLLQ